MAISPYAVHPVYAAMAAATLDEYFPGRVALCLGVGAPKDLEAAGIATPQPVDTLREAIAVTRRDDQRGALGAGLLRRRVADAGAASYDHQDLTGKRSLGAGSHQCVR